jgi:nicotinamidase-related amidase
MNPERTAIILIGFQNDYFLPTGVLYQVIEAAARASKVLANTLDLVARLAKTPVTLICTPISFTPDYSELKDPVGILKAVRDLGAFQHGKEGSETIAELRQFGDRILSVPGKRGLNAFSNTALDAVLKERGIEDVVIAGVVTSICVDSTGRFAAEQGYRTTILSNCTSGRTEIEQSFYIDNIMPLYARVMDSSALLGALGIAA